MVVGQSVGAVARKCRSARCRVLPFVVSIDDALGRACSNSDFPKRLISQPLDKAIERLQERRCNSDAGCFRCIANPYASEIASKGATGRVLESLRDELSGDFKTTQVEYDVLSSESPITNSCSACQSPVKIDDRFCSNYGEKLP